MRVYVMPKNSKWIVKRESSDEILASHYRKEKAIESAKEISLGHDSELIVLREYGTIDNLDGYGVNPFPSEDNAPEYREDDSESYNLFALIRFQNLFCCGESAGKRSFDRTHRLIFG
jgi:hypothetical protein